jgi:hypothetical protein
MTKRRALIQAEPDVIGLATITFDDARCAELLIHLLRLQRASDAAYARVPGMEAAAREGGSARRAPRPSIGRLMTMCGRLHSIRRALGAPWR